MKKFLKSYLAFFAIIMYLEIVYKLVIFGGLNALYVFYTAIFSLGLAMLYTILNVFLRGKTRYFVLLINLILLTFIFIGEAVFTLILNVTFSFYSLNLAGQALDFLDIIFSFLKNNWFIIVTFLIPLILYIIFHKKIEFNKSIEKLPKYLFGELCLCLLPIMIVSVNSKDVYSPYNLYFNTHAPTVTANKLGLITMFRLDLTRYLFGFESKVEIKDTSKEIVRAEKVEYNEKDLNLDFYSDNLEIDEINRYIKSKKPAEKNEYTGTLKDKNLIYILAEGFNTIAVDKELTPTLYKMINSGYKFNNYYSPIFMSTTGGEFQYSLSLIPTQETLTRWKEGNLYFPYSLGNVFTNMGYTVNAYHDWTYTYYKRDITMPDLGYTNYTACGNGLEKKINCKVWPPSDVEMINATVDDYIDEDHFMTFYITVSGHAEYNFDGNYIANKNQDLVKDLDYPEDIKAYIATQMELDKALEILLERLEESNKLDDTVIVISGDHYPYTIPVDIINTRSTYERDLTFEVNNSNLIMYNPNFKNEEIDELVSSVDVVPTLLNMFGYDYDSRLLMGNDIFSDHEKIVIFSDYSWITDKGRYDAKTGIFTPKNSKTTVSNSYIEDINSRVQQDVKISTSIVKYNYYKVLEDNQTINE